MIDVKYMPAKLQHKIGLRGYYKTLCKIMNVENQLDSICQPPFRPKKAPEKLFGVKVGLTNNEVISIDRKTMRGTREYGSKSIVHMVSAWVSGNHIVLGQLKVEEKSNEITAIPKLLSLLVLKGCIVTIDAMGCQKDITSAIIDKEADYLLALKGNQGNLQEQVEDSFRFLPVVSISEETDMGHGRIETRRCSVITDLSMIESKRSVNSVY